MTSSPNSPRATTSLPPRSPRVAAGSPGRSKADAMLGSLYPAGVAGRLRSGRPVTAETVGKVTFVVTLIHGRDVLTARHSAAEMSEILGTDLSTLNATAA